MENPHHSHSVANWCIGYRPIGCHRSSKHTKSLSSLNVTRRLLYVSFRLPTSQKKWGYTKVWLGLVSDLGLVVSAVYRPVVFTMSLIFYLLSADSGRNVDTPMRQLATPQFSDHSRHRNDSSLCQDESCFEISWRFIAELDGVIACAWHVRSAHLQYHTKQLAKKECLRNDLFRVEWVVKP